MTAPAFEPPSTAGANSIAPSALARPLRLTPESPSRMLRAPIMRVIAGELGGRRLVAPRGERTRPTSDRVRESLFMWLGDLTGAHVVDLYAGSGALGIEALSRGAAFVDFVEHDRRAREALDANLAALELGGRARVWPLVLPRGLKRIASALAGAALVLADPPYGGAPARATLAALGTPGVLPPSARVVVERHGKDVLPERSGSLKLAEERRYGETVLNLYLVETPCPPEPEHR